MQKKNKNETAIYYKSLPRKQKGQFVMWLRTLTNLGQTTILRRIAMDYWSPLERDAIRKGIEEATWK